MCTISYKTKDDSFVPFQAHPGEWIDLWVAEDYTLTANSFTLLDLGVVLRAPSGHEIILAPRSSTFKKYGILQANGIGVIDNSYCGEDDWVMFPAFATRDIVIPKGTRIAQFRVQPTQGNIYLIKTERMSSDNRGGFGSTGD